ncbi:MAG TPA: pyridoxamine 5'-phosphate oxidase family protein [Gaiellaceae bacterium]|nr:pyridoxamine 5'-phosphate oxidase family protein [Gaiellaceae bacterium]
MPAAPLPAELLAFLAAPRPAVVGTVRPDGTPVTTACWYGLEDDRRILLTMDRDSHRLKHLRADPRVALTVLGDDWYNQLSLLGHAVEFREDADFADMDRLALRYLGETYQDRSYTGVSVFFEVDRWHTWGDPAAEAA